MLFDKIINTAFSLGAAIVIFGAWSKIEHKEYGDDALTAGLLTETAIFIIYGVLEWRRQPEVSALVSKEEPPTPAASAGPEEGGELTESIRQTARILNKIFRV